jgi:hypothetical protein
MKEKVQFKISYLQVSPSMYEGETYIWLGVSYLQVSLSSNKVRMENWSLSQNDGAPSCPSIEPWSCLNDMQLFHNRPRERR